MVGVNFEPHITLTVFKDQSCISELPPLKFESRSFDADKISICELGPSHSCQRIVEPDCVLVPAFINEAKEPAR